jgi:hypothetical protein
MSDPFLTVRLRRVDRGLGACEVERGLAEVLQEMARERQSEPGAGSSAAERTEAIVDVREYEVDLTRLPDVAGSLPVGPGDLQVQVRDTVSGSDVTQNVQLVADIYLNQIHPHLLGLDSLALRETVKYIVSEAVRRFSRRGRGRVVEESDATAVTGGAAEAHRHD